METLVPNRTQISDRFPIASFDVRVPESRCFEVACATDPRLFHTDWRPRRTSRNFYTSRGGGLMVAPRGRTTWLMPSDQLKRFAGAKRIYYALASYGGPMGGDPRFSISPQSLDEIPSIGLASDFTGRALDRTRLGYRDPASDAYGTAETTGARWGGDDALDCERQSGEDGPGAPAYDDGFDGAFWTGDGGTQVAQGTILQERASAPAKAARFSGRSDEWGDDEPPEDESADGALAATGAALAMATEDSEYEPDNEDDFDSGYSFDRGYSAEADFQQGAAEDTWAEEDEELEAYDDPQGIYGAVAYHVGSGRSAVLEATAPADAGFLAPSGKDSEYWEDGEDAELVPALAAVPLDIPEQIRILRVVGQAESGSDGYSAVNPDSEFNTPGHRAYQKYHIGLSWGFIQFTQRSRALGKVLKATRKRELRTDEPIPAAQQMPAVFGPAWQQLLDVTNAATADARLAAVEAVELWCEPWLGRFKAAGALDHVRAAQNEVAITDYLDPIVPIARWLGIATPRGISLLLDRCVNMGVRGGSRWVLDTVGPVRSDADRAACLQALGKPDLAAFQAGVPGLDADGKWGPRSHAAMIAALRELGAGSPVEVPTPAEVLKRLADGATGRPFEQRVRRLLENQTDFDDTVEYAIP